MTPQNYFRVKVFWNEVPPLGICGVTRRLLIDVDKFGLTLKKRNRNGRWSLMCYRVRKDGHYKRGLKITCLLAIEPGDPRLPQNVRGSIEKPWHWVRCIQNGGTINIVCWNFCDHICSDIEQNLVVYGGLDTDDCRIFLWDDLKSHHSAYVNQMVRG